jgi:hypothetical protein
VALAARFRLSLILISVAAVGAICIRTAVVSAEFDATPPLASWVSRGHPEALGAAIMQGVTRAASRGTPIDAQTAKALDLLSHKAPLSPQPFAVKGAIALRDGRQADAERLLVEARRRDPRDRGVRFLLADLFLREGKVVAGLQELAVLGTLSPGVSPSIAEMLAEYARAPGAIAAIREVLRRQPGLEHALLSKLAEDASNADLILSLAERDGPQNDLLDWQKKLLSSLVKAGEFRRAQDLWRQFSGRTEARIGDFADSKVTSPFTWSLLSSSDGSATATERGLEVQFFGRADAALASRLILLPAGEYELRYRLMSSGEGTALHWRVDCLPNGGALLDAPLAKAPDGNSTSRFTVPLGCQAQRITLQGLAAVYPGEIDVSVADLEVRRRG